MFSPIDLVVKPNQLLALLQSGLWLLPMLLTGLSDWPWPAKTGLLAGLLTLAGIGFFRQQQKNTYHLRLDDRGLQRLTAQGELIPLPLAGSSRVFARLAILNPRQIPRLRRATAHIPDSIILSDLPGIGNVDPLAFRRLRVWLRFHPQKFAALRDTVSKDPAPRDGTHAA